MARKILTYRLLIRDSDWLNFIQLIFSTQEQDKVSFDIRKREDQALISISIILKFSALCASQFEKKILQRKKKYSWFETFSFAG